MEIALTYILPILAANVKGLASWLGSRIGVKDEAFDARKQLRTAVTGVVTMIIAYALGLKPTEGNLAEVTAAYGFVISFIDTLVVKYVFKRVGLQA